MDDTSRDQDQQRLGNAQLPELPSFADAALQADGNYVLCRFLPDTTLTYVDPAYCRMLGQPRETLIGLRWLDVVPETDQLWIRDLLRRLTPDNPTVTYSHACLTLLGEEHWLQWTDRGLFDDSGRLVEIEAVGRDLTRLRETQQELRSNQRHHRLLLDHVPVQIWYLLDPTTYGAVNEAHARFLGYDAPYELSFRPLTEVLHAGHTGVFGDPGGEVFRHGRPCETQVEVHDTNGSPRFLWLTKTPKTDEQGAVRYVVCSAQDITAFHQAEQSFLASVTHDLRTPLSTVAGGLHLLETSKTLGGEERETVALCQQATQHLTEMIETLLELSTIRAGRLTLHPRPFDLSGTIDTCIRAYREQARNKGLGLSARIEPALSVQRIGDPDRIGQVLLNLLDNAIKFTERGEVTVHARDDGHRRVRIEVADTGPGIPLPSQELIFRSFERGPLRDTTSSSGLGLTMCRQLVERMEGSIGLESEVRCGSTFYLTLPLPTTAEATAEPQGLRDRSAHEEPGTASGMAPLMNRNGQALRVLLAEDNHINQRLTRKLLESMGVQCQVVPNGREAVQAYRSCAIDLVLMDLRMPLMDGAEAITRIRSFEQRDGLARTPILALTASPQTDEAYRHILGEVDDWIRKPIEPETLRSALERFAGTEPPPPPKASEPPLMDWDEALRRTGARESLLRESLHSFRADLPQHRTRLHNAFRQQAWEALAREAHTVKNLCQTFCMHQAAEAARRLEVACTSGHDAQSVETQVDQLHTAVRRLETFLRQEQS
ncbi:MAG: PAS domain S-box protein [Halorhodospira halophila]|uniref:PAS domain-containing sensor histidine kinase n=1 Tax=Halorhodospira halophila TaxID=1053 RepID=UPI0026EA281F|nr:PAS domain-containing sensor histidine kinase [Halorhodospira halophila]MCC3751080.1 PAS domain S-box protein [Halorhodospira halophila]